MQVCVEGWTATYTQGCESVRHNSQAPQLMLVHIYSIYTYIHTWRLLCGSCLVMTCLLIIGIYRKKERHRSLQVVCTDASICVYINYNSCLYIHRNEKKSVANIRKPHCDHVWARSRVEDMITTKAKGHKIYSFRSTRDSMLEGFQARQTASSHYLIEGRVPLDVSFRQLGVKLVGELANHKVARQPASPCGEQGRPRVLKQPFPAIGRAFVPMQEDRAAAR